MANYLPPFELASSIATIGVLTLCVRYLCRDSRSAPPGPRPLPIIGNLLDIPQHEQWLVYREWSHRYQSDVIHMNVFGTDLLVVNSAQAASALFGQKSAIYSDRPRMPMLAELIGLGWHFAFMKTGDDWRAHRKIFTQEFSPSAVQRYHDQELKWTRKLLQNLIAKPQNFMEHIQHMASGIVLETTFGLQVQPSGQPDPFIAAAKQAVEAMTESGLFGTYLVDFLPILKYVPAWLPFATFKRQANKWRKSSDIAAQVPFSVMKNGLATNDYVPSVASKLVTGGEHAGDETALRQTVSAMFASGSAATVSALTTFILAMCLYPEVQAKAQKEIDQVVVGRLPNFSDEPNLPYITAIIREVGRWNPVAPLAFPHMLSADDTYNGYRLKAGSVVFPNTWAILHDPVEYPEPHLFKPERFLTHDGKVNPQVKDPEAVWGFGRRICPGRKMATSSMYITIAAVLATFNISPAVDSDGKPIQISGEYGSGMLRYPKAFECSIKPRSEEAAAFITEAD